MSASRFFPDAAEGATDARHYPVARLDDDDRAAVRLEAHDDDPSNGERVALLPLVPAVPTPGSDPIIVEDHASPPADTPAAVDRESFDDLQPMLDLRFPEAAQPPLELVPVADAGHADENRIELLHADGASVTDVPVLGSEPEVIASFVEVPGEGSAAPMDAPGEAQTVLHALEPGGLRAGTVDDPADATDASTRSAYSAPDVAGAATVARDEAPFAAPAEVDGLDDAPEGGLSQPVPVEDDPTRLRIAAEADATAQALENLKRLLAHKLPDLSAETTARPTDLIPVQPPPIQAAAPTDFAHQDDGIENFEFPPPRGERHGRRAGFAFGSFFSGFAASWIFGAVLYAYLMFG